MARGGGTVASAPQIQIPSSGPSPLAALMQSLAQTVSGMMQNKAQEEALKIEKERLKIEQDRAKMEQQQRAAEGQAATALMASDPRMARFLGTGGAPSMLQAPQLPSRPSPAPAQQFASAAPMVSPQGMPAPTMAPSPPRVTPAPAAQPLAPVANGGRGITPEVARSLLPQLQKHLESQAQLRESDARVTLAGAQTQGEIAQTEATKVKTRWDEQRMVFDRELQPLLVAERQSSIAANQSTVAQNTQQIAESRARVQQITAATATIARDAAHGRLEAYRNMVTTFGAVMPVAEARAEASRLLFGTNAPPKLNEIVAEESAFIERAMSAGRAGNLDPRALGALVEQQKRVNFAERSGISADIQTFLDQQLQVTNGDPNKVMEAVNSSTNEGVRAHANEIAVYLSFATGKLVDPKHLGSSYRRRGGAAPGMRGIDLSNQ